MKHKKTKSKIIAKKARPLAKQGFTLVEMLMSLLIFTIIVVLLSGTFAGFLRNYKRTKDVQTSFEDAQFALNVMAKTLASSSIQMKGSNEIDAFDNTPGSQTCYKYKYVPATHKLQSSAAVTAGVSDITSCANTSPTFSDMISTPVLGVSIDADTSSSPNKVTIAIIVQKDAKTGQLFPVQTTVSMRDVPQ